MDLRLLAKRELFKRYVLQDLIYNDFNKYNYFLIDGGRAGGKTQRIARLLLLLAMQNKVRIFCGREIQATIKDSVYTALKNIIIDLQLDFEVLANGIRNELGSEFIFKGFREQGKYNIQGLEDIDILWIDEAQAITKPTLDIILPTIRKKNSKIIFTMNRCLEKDPVFEIFNRNAGFDKSLHLTMNYLNNKFLDSKILELAEQQKNIDYQDYLHIWMGEPKKENENDCILSLLKLRDAINRDIEISGGVVIGIDVARFGDDRSVMYKRAGYKIIDSRFYNSKDIQNGGLVRLADYAEDLANYKKDVVFNVDDTGVGGGLTDILRSRDYLVNAINNGGVPKERELNKKLNINKTPSQPDYNFDRYDNVITEMFFEFRDILDKISIPDDDELLNELSSRKFNYTKDQKKRVENKDDFKKRYGKSPDKGDALLLTYYVPAIKPKMQVFVL